MATLRWIMLAAMAYSGILLAVLWARPTAQDQYVESVREEARALFPGVEFSEMKSSEQFRAKFPRQDKVTLRAELDAASFAAHRDDLIRRLPRMGEVIRAEQSAPNRYVGRVYVPGRSMVDIDLWSGGRGAEKRTELIVTFTRPRRWR